MSFVISSINPYVNETKEQLIEKTILVGKTMDLVTVIPGIKYKESINQMANTIAVRNATCGFTPNGSIAFTQRIIEVTPLEVKDTLCPKTLETIWLAQSFKPGAPKDLELGPIIAESYVKNIRNFNEKKLWVGATGSNSFQGFVQLLGQEVTRVQDVGSTYGYTASHVAGTIIAIVNKHITLIPEELLEEEVTLFMSNANYDLYCAALVAANQYHYTADATKRSMIVPGTGVRLEGMLGLTGTNYMVLTVASNLIVGTDMMNEDEKFDIWYSQDNDEVRVNVQWKYGTQCYWPEFCVCNF